MSILDHSTMQEEEAGRGPSRPGLRLTLLWHADPARVGEVLILPPNVRTVQLSRTAPDFPGGPPGDPYLSRAPLELRVSDGGVVAWPAAPSLTFTVDGLPGVPGQAIADERLGRGVRIAVGRRLLVLLERGDTAAGTRVAHGLVGASVAMAELRAAVERVAARTDPVLIRGETGTGKDLVARAIHASSPRCGGPFVAVNVAAIPAETAASQLFGHAAGAFTGAARSHGGFFGEAEGGTLFLDEIGELPDALQPLLLRALDAREVQPVGGRARRVDVRVVAATDADLDGLVQQRRFRPALLHRLAVHDLRIEPLRARPADLATQAAWFAQAERVPLSARLMAALLDQPWPGNSRQLKAMLARVSVDGEDSVVAQLATAPRPADSAATDVLGVLAANGYAVDATAAALGIAKNTLYAQMAAAGIPRGQDLDATTISSALAAAGGDPDLAAGHLRVSARALRLRMRALGLAPA